MSSFYADSSSSIWSISREMRTPVDAETSQRFKLKTRFKKIIRSILILLKVFRIKRKSQISLFSGFSIFIRLDFISILRYFEESLLKNSLFEDKSIRLGDQNSTNSSLLPLKPSFKSVVRHFKDFIIFQGSFLVIRFHSSFQLNR